MTTSDVQLQLCASTSASTYSFLCPVCSLLVNKQASEQVVGVLVGSGVRVVSWVLPAELDEPKLGPAITHDDLLGFHFTLSEAGWLERSVEQLAAADPLRARR